MNHWTLADVTDATRVAERLADAGFSRACAAEKGAQFARVARRLIDEGNAAAAGAVAYYVPGRIEVFGKHTDYAGGRSVVAAAERGFCGVAAARVDQLVEVIDSANEQRVEFSLSPDLVPTLGRWSNYPMTVVRRVARNFPDAREGLSMAFASDLPVAAGMSSSSALMVMTFLLLGELNGIAHDRTYQANIRSLTDLAGYLGTVENGQTFQGLAGDRGVGTFGGSEDHTAILCSRPGQWSQFAYCPVRQERMIQAPQQYLFVIGVSGVVAEKTGAARQQYNRASRRASVVAEMWRQATGRADPHLAAAIRSAPNAVDRLRALLRDQRHDEFQMLELTDRLEQFVAENEEIIPAIPDRVDAASLQRLGDLARRSQQLGAEQLGNQIPETVFLADAAHQLGAVAASAFGAGFGGSVWALVHQDHVAQFMQRWSTAYLAAYPDAGSNADFFVTRAGASATSLGASTFLPDVG